MVEYNRLNMIERNRRQVPCYFKDGISRDEFSSIAYNVAKK